MAKQCPISGEIVLYADCLECEDKDRCRNPTIENNSNNTKITNNNEKQLSNQKSV